jgi:hypothetical protein
MPEPSRDWPPRTAARAPAPHRLRVRVCGGRPSNRDEFLLGERPVDGHVASHPSVVLACPLPPHRFTRQPRHTSLRHGHSRPLSRRRMRPAPAAGNRVPSVSKDGQRGPAAKPARMAFSNGSISSCSLPPLRPMWPHRSGRPRRPPARAAAARGPRPRPRDACPARARTGPSGPAARPRLPVAHGCERHGGGEVGQIAAERMVHDVHADQVHRAGRRGRLPGQDARSGGHRGLPAIATAEAGARCRTGGAAEPSGAAVLGLHSPYRVTSEMSRYRVSERIRSTAEAFKNRTDAWFRAWAGLVDRLLEPRHLTWSTPRRSQAASSCTSTDPSTP